MRLRIAGQRWSNFSHVRFCMILSRSQAVYVMTLILRCIAYLAIHDGHLSEGRFAMASAMAPGPYGILDVDMKSAMRARVIKIAVPTDLWQQLDRKRHSEQRKWSELGACLFRQWLEGEAQAPPNRSRDVQLLLDILKGADEETMMVPREVRAFLRERLRQKPDEAGVVTEFKMEAIELMGDVLLATVTGTLELNAAARVSIDMFDSAIQKQTTKILMDDLAVLGDLFESERLQVALKIAAHLKQHRFKPRLAVVGNPPAIDAFGVRILKMFGYAVEAFPNRIDALAWQDSAG